MANASEPFVQPLYQTSVFAIPDLDALDRLYSGEAAGFIYARDGHPNAHHLAEQLARLEGGTWSLVCGSGMAAISTCLLPLVKQGDRVVASNWLYGRTSQLLRQELPRFGVQTTFVDCNDLDVVRTALRTPTRVLYIETMSNPLCRTLDIPVLAEISKAADCRLIVDNTFATPELCKPLEMGADLVMESLTKMMGGHGDITLGCVSGRDLNLKPSAESVSSVWGFASNPFDCWLSTRSLATLSMRVRTATANAAALADWLAAQPGVTRVVYPGRADHPDYQLAKRMFPGGCGNMVCMELAGGREAVNRFMRAAPGIAFTPSLGSTRTTCSYPWATSHRFDSHEVKNGQGIGEGLVRLSIGVEDLTAIKREFAKGLGS